MTSASLTDASSAKEDTSEDSAESSSQYSTDVTAFTISPDANRLLSVSVDELDINSVELGQKAVVTFDAIEERENVLTLPMNALQEKGDRTFVYTEKDDEGNLSGETEVETGLSDGSTVEITDGLEEGITVYYLRSGNSSNDSGNTDMQMPDMGGNGMACSCRK